LEPFDLKYSQLIFIELSQFRETGSRECFEK
jgi:hypothetical protein